MAASVIATKTAGPGPDAGRSEGQRLRRKCACEDSGASCERCSAGKTLQRKASGSPGAGVVPAIVHDVLDTAGRPLDSSARGDMERRFGQNFSDVKVHTDSAAAASARNVGALAYTVGSHIVFGSNTYAPQSPFGHHV